jgi:uncharacterized protein YkwD
MMLAARQTQAVAPLAHDPELDQLALAHARAMRRAALVAHDVGDGDPAERLDPTGSSQLLIGENVAHAATIRLAHRALWRSPSHRLNLLQPRFDRFGVGVSTDADGSVWITELFSGPK